MFKCLCALRGVIFVGVMVGCGSPELDRIELIGDNMDNGELILVKGRDNKVFYDAYDTEGQDWFQTASSNDRRKQKWSVDKSTVVTLESVEWSIGEAHLTGTVDWFDVIPNYGNFSDGYEPSSTVKVSIGEISDSLVMRVVMDTSGRWEFSITGSLPRTINVIQDGRLLTCEEYSGCTGEIRDNILTFSFDGYELYGLYSVRGRIEGVFSDAQGITGLWSASRH